MNLLLEFKNVSKSFGGVRALSDVSFSVGKGEFVFIVGASGAGKTTILRLLMAEYKPTSGTIIFDGRDLSKIKKRDVPYLRQRIGAVFQDFKLLKERSIRENIEVALDVVGVDKKEWKARVDQVLKLVGLSHRSELFPLQLSGGELQRVAIARALVVNPQLIFADEPTGNLDWDTAETIMDLLSKINKEGKTVIVTSHNKEIIDRMKKRVIVLKDGKIASSKSK
ncbi:MAG TPA: cell division ATP-binding protein FtsE [Patescibacteria group bacterium]